MAQHLFEDLCKAEGFCCPLAYLKASKPFRTAILAEHLGVEPRTIRKWKAKFKADVLHCPHEANCQKLHPRAHPLIKESIADDGYDYYGIRDRG